MITEIGCGRAPKTLAAVCWRWMARGLPAKRENRASAKRPIMRRENAGTGLRDATLQIFGGWDVEGGDFPDLETLLACIARVERIWDGDGLNFSAISISRDLGLRPLGRHRPTASRARYR